MATSEMHVEEVVVVTTPDGGGEAATSVDDLKTVLVDVDLTHAGSLSHREGEVLADGSMEAETDADALAKEAVIGVLEQGNMENLQDSGSRGPEFDAPTVDRRFCVKMSEEVDVEADIVYPVTCGDVKATLVWKKFVCPGINIKCVQFNEHLISPKEFVSLAGKSTLKDWKRAIRLNGTMLRKIMDSGELDFYQHSKVCSNTCRSTKIDLVGTRVSLSSQQSTEFIPVTPSTDVNGSPAAFPAEAVEESTEWVTAIGEDSVTFWRGLKEAGLLEEVVEDFQNEIQEVLKGMQERVAEPPLQVKDAVLLNNIVQNFGMLELVKKVLASHKSQMDRYREQYTRSLAALEQQCDEHRKRAKELKSKSQHLNNVLMTLAPVPAPPTPKRPRLTRAVSGPAAVNATPAPTQITLPLSQLAGLPLGKVLTMTGTQSGAATPLGSYTVLTSPGGTAELAPDASNLTVLSTAAAVQEGTANFLKVLGPQYQLITLPASLGATLQGLTCTPQGTMVALPVGNNNLTTAALEGQVDVQIEEQAGEEEEEEVVVPGGEVEEAPVEEEQ